MLVAPHPGAIRENVLFQAECEELSGASWEQPAPACVYSGRGGQPAAGSPGARLWSQAWRMEKEFFPAVTTPNSTEEQSGQEKRREVCPTHISPRG